MASLLSPAKQPLIIDFETYYDANFSLKKLPTLLYIRSPEFAVHGAAVAFGDQPASWVTGTDLPLYFGTLDWESVCVISHNALFDCTVLHEKYGIVPAQYVDTLGLCRALLYHDLDFSLSAICELLGIGSKIDGLEDVKGLRTLNSDQEFRLAQYAIQDAELERALFNLLWPLLPDSEAAIMHEVIRMSVVGTLEFDCSLGAAAATEIDAHRQALLTVLGVTPEQLRSRNEFAALLRARGVAPPVKTSPTTGAETYAFSKQDPEFVALQEHEDVADLVQARLAWSSNNARTRVENLVKICSAAPYTLPVQLNYSGAHTHRLSGGGKINMMALDRGSALRRAIKAPKDHVLMVFDLKNIELRMNMWFCGQQDLVDLMTPGEYVYHPTRTEWVGEDLYIREAQRQFDRVQITKDERQYAKVVQLGCGYGMGFRRFKTYCATGPMGIKPIQISLEDAERTITIYRSGVPCVVAMWRYLQQVVLPQLMDPHGSHKLQCLTISHETITLPSGLQLMYPNLRHESDDATGELQLFYGAKSRRRIYGPKLLENCIQALATEVLKTYMGKLYKSGLPWTTVHQVHDELIGVVPERHADEVMRALVEQIVTEVDWAPGLAVRTDISYGHTYDK